MSNTKNQEKLNKNNYFFEKFLSIEKDFNLLDQEISGIPFWELVRYPLYQKIVHGNGSKQSKHSSDRNSQNWLRRIGYFIASLTYRSPFLAKRNVLLFFGHPRKKFENEVFLDPYTDPFLNCLQNKYDFSVIEKPITIGFHYHPTTTKNLYLDSFLEIKTLYTRIFSINLTNDYQSLFTEIGNLFNEYFGVEIDVEGIVKKAILRWKIEYFLYRCLFYYLNPKIIFLVVSAGFEPMIAAAHSLDITTVELQHGSPALGKLNYHYPIGNLKKTFPSYFLSFGEIYSSYISLPEERIIPIGFPYLSHKISQNYNIHKQDQIIVLSQPGKIGTALAKFSEDLAQKLEGKIKIIYKLHPKETCEANQKYSYLKNKGIIVADQDWDLYTLLASSRWQLGVYSTALYEGIAFSCITFILEAPGAEAMRWLISEKGAKLVHKPEDLESSLKWTDINFDHSENFRKKIFSPVSSKAILSFIDSII